MTEKSVPVIRLRDGIPGPIRQLCVEKDDSRVLITYICLAPHIPVAFWVVAGASRFLKPRMLVRSMIYDHLDDDAYSTLMLRFQYRLEIFMRTVVYLIRN